MEKKKYTPSKTALENRKAYNRKYRATKQKKIYITLNVNTDADLLKVWEGIPNRSGFVKECIRKYAASKGKKQGNTD